MDRELENRMSDYMVYLLRDTQHPIKECRQMFLAKFPEGQRYFNEMLSEWLD